MEQAAIAELTPELPSLDSKHFCAVVTLIWPYSSSARQFAVLLADPDLRRRRRNGQVRARFEGSSAKAIAKTGVGIGDEIVLALRGVQFVRDSSINTPGKSIDWELLYTQTLDARIIRGGSEIASLNLDHVAPTPANRSPVRQHLPSPLAGPQTWASPAFVKRARLPQGPIFEAGYDPFNDDSEGNHDRKRRRMSYRDWNAWTYSARTPSPEKEYEDLEDSDTVPSPLPQSQLPTTPLSPPNPEAVPASSPHVLGDDPEVLQEEHVDSYIVQNERGDHHESTLGSPKDGFVRDTDYYDLYAGPDELPPREPEIELSDTVSNTSEESALPAMQTATQISVSGSDAEDFSENKSEEPNLAVLEVLSESNASEIDEEPVKPLGSFSVIEMDEATSVDDDTTLDHEQRHQGRSDGADEPLYLEEVPAIAMPPPPTLPLLQTNFQTPFNPGMLTPIGKEPSSPNLLPLDSATLPMPSPFPGGQDDNALSYLEHTGNSQTEVAAQAQQQDTNGDDEFVVESSFYSSVSAYDAANSHANHESAFTEVRFTFGMDGSAFSHPAASVQEEGENRKICPAGPNKEQDPDAGGANTHSPEEDTVDNADEVRAAAEVQPQPTAPELHEREEVISLSDPGSENDDDEHQVLDHVPAPQKEPQVEPHDDKHDPVTLGDVEVDSLIPEPFVKDDIVHQHLVKPFSTDFPAVIAAASHVRVSREHSPETTQQSVAVTEVIDLGSASEDEGETEVPDEEEPAFTVPESFQDTHFDDAYHPCIDNEVDILFTEPDDYDQNLVILSSPVAPQLPGDDDGALAQQDDHQANSQQGNEGGASVLDGHDSQVAAETEAAPPEEPPMLEAISLDEHADTGDLPDVKMESIEEDTMEWVPSLESSQQEPSQSETAPVAELTIAVPVEGHKMGEMELVSVPTTGPARNTRSKTKPSNSPSKEATPGLKRSSRSRRLKSPAASVARTTLSPTGATSMSTVSPTKETTVTSPYYLRSQSKHLSPTESATPVPQSKQSRNRSERFSSADMSSPSKGGFVERGSSPPSETFELPGFSFGPSQELGVSQGKYANVSFVKDSEEGSLRSGSSLSTVQHSDDWNMGTQTYLNFSDPVEPRAHDYYEVPSHSSPHGDLSSTTPTKPRSSPNQRTGPRVVIPVKSSPSRPRTSVSAEPFQSSPTRKLRSPVRSMSGSPRTPRQVRKETQVSTGDNDMTKQDVQFKAAGITYPALPTEHEPNGDTEQHFVSVDNQLPSSPPPTQSKLPSTYHQSAISRRGQMTPEASQQTFAASQASIPTYHQSQSMPMTPQLTQNTAFEPTTSQANLQLEREMLEQHLELSPIAKSTPRRNVTAEDVGSEPASPATHSAVESPTSVEEVSRSELPSIGLSTPISYYTPLKDLPFFLNRSSQFHSASSPDILALVTSTSTPPKRAPSGPKHHTTTLHITDLSTHPASTTVQVFRPYVTALPVADKGDVILLRAFTVRSLNRRPMLVSGDESAWCVWRFSKLLWGKKREAFGEIKEREEVKGPMVERGAGEWAEVKKLRAWWVRTVGAEVEERKGNGVHTRSMGKELELSQADARGEVDEDEAVDESKV